MTRVSSERRTYSRGGASRPREQPEPPLQPVEILSKTFMGFMLLPYRRSQ